MLTQPLRRRRGPPHQVQAERDKLTEKLRAKTQEAKELREARTGEIAPITEEIIDDGAGTSEAPPSPSDRDRLPSAGPQATICRPPPQGRLLAGTPPAGPLP